VTDKQDKGVEVEAGLTHGGGYGAAGTGGDEVEPGARQLLMHLHVLLRGRYILLVILSLLLGAGLGYGGFKLGYKTYRSTALIQITRPLPFFDGVTDESQDVDYVPTQAGLIKTQRVIDAAMADSRWVGLARPVKDPAVATEEFTQALTVVPKDRMIYVTFEDRDPRAVSAGLKCVLDAYQMQFVEKEKALAQRRIDILQGQQTALESEDRAALGEIDTISRKYGTEDLAPVYIQQRATAERLAELLAEMTTRQAVASKRPGVKGEDAQDWASMLDRVEVEELAQKDPQLMRLLTDRSDVERRLRDLASVHGYGETHPRVLEQKKLLESAELDVAARARKVREQLKKVRPSVAGVPTDPTELAEKVASLTTMHKEADDKATELGKLNLQLKKAQQKREDVRPELETYKKRVKMLLLQQMAGDKIKVLSDGTAAAAAQTDTRVRFAGIGAFLGLMLAFGLSVIPGLLDRRFHAADDTQLGNFMGPVLGVLPGLPGGLADAENAAMAAYCVHQTRALLQMRHRGSHGQALAVTSSVAGTGKTSLTLALGVSFATSGSRTLMIDCDVVGGGLSARVSRMTQRKIGDLLRREGLITAQQLEQALARARTTGARFGDTCVELGFASEADVERVIESQDEQHMGVLEALAGESLEDCIAATGFPGLFILPLGTASARHCASISPTALKRLLKVARAKFDTVLIDTGPVPGSLEASVVAPQADGVVVVVSKGEDRPAVARCVEHLRTVGANTVGVVFNRASLNEVSRNASTLHRSAAAFGSSSSSGMGLQLDAEQSRKSDRLGPIAQAVAGCAPADNQAEGN
jgi:Mrp family chromosome partitioning ATPase/uncharacterized protein involved in exopolysaccharide biosynthesis